MNKIRLTESKLHRVIKESVNKVLREGLDFKPTFDNDEVQNRWKNDTIQMLSQLSDEKFMEKYFNKRLSFDDPATVDAIWQEYVRRKNNLE